MITARFIAHRHIHADRDTLRERERQ